MMTQAFGFRHLPQAGGIYDQNPMMLERFMYILGAQEEERERKEAKRTRDQGGPAAEVKGPRSRPNR